ncbi:MAG: ATP-binding protein [Prochlorotrichaceae cyanobacterium]
MVNLVTRPTDRSDGFNSAILRETLGALQLWRSDVVGLLLYRGVFSSAIGQVWQRLLTQILDPHPRAQDCVLAYGDWFYALAASGQCWSEQIIAAIGLDDNPFSQQAQYRSLSEIPEGLQEAVRRDLQALQRLAQADLGLLSRAVEQIAHPLKPLMAIDGIPLNTRHALREQSFVQNRSQSIAKVFSTIPDAISRDSLPATVSLDWSDRLSELATHYRQWGVGLWGQYACFRWHNGALQGLAHPDPVQLDQLVGYEDPKAVLVQNTEFLLQGYPAQNILLYGSRGSGKSSLIKALPHTYASRGLRLLEVPKSELHHLPQIVEQVRSSPQKFVLFVDDLSFEEDDDTFKSLKVVLEGNLTPRPANLVVYATTNRRHLVREFTDDRPRPQDATEIYAWDTLQEKLSFSDRFGLTLTFEPTDQNTYLEIVRHLAQQAQLAIDPADLDFQAKQWATRHNGRSGRTARQFIDWCIAHNLNCPQSE